MPEKVEYRALRDKMVDHLREQYLGPAGGEDELLVNRPDRVYLVGTLYPRGPAHAPQDGDTLGEEGHEIGLDDPVELANAWHPASAAISFLHDGTALRCTVTAGRYARSRDDKGWRRSPAISRDVILTPEEREAPVLDGAGRLVSVWRPTANAHLVTVALENTAISTDPKAEPSTGDCLFQVALHCDISGGTVRPYPSVQALSDDTEEQELRLLYRHRKVYGVGHGCSVQWQAEPASATSDEAQTPGPVTRTGAEGTSVTWVATDMMPCSVVPGVSPGDRKDPVLNLASLADPDRPVEDLVNALRTFVGRYTTWIAGQTQQAQELSGNLAARRIIDRLERAAARMLEGIDLLGNNHRPNVLTAFRLANQTMREQILQTNHTRSHPGRRGEPLPERDPDAAEPAWYPFQLAFQLLTIPSVSDPDHDDRGLVDLIWFPTGGGKTEAYLAVAAFDLIHRRLMRGAAGGGTAVITRYTLRMLTAQQFQRAATLICALQQLHPDHPRLRATPEFSIGLWGGGESTPNDYATAKDQADALRSASTPKSPFQVAVCPWCGTPMVPSKRTTIDPGAYGVRASKHHFELHCTHDDCPFHELLPILVVDDQIYAAPPSILIATVDKFARVAWVANSGSLFGRDGQPCDPPSLIIQDELHLLSGPLGTTVAVYESALLGLIGWDGIRPKVISSTATIRSAPEQVRRLYGADVALFPPSGLSADNSHFAATDHSLPGRMYVGLMPQAHTQSYSTVLACLALLNAPVAVDENRKMLDAYWTLVAYHNSLRELGRTVTLVRDDVDTALTRRSEHASDGSVRILRRDGVLELTSNVGATELGDLMRRLERNVDEPDAVDLVATTNMLSVGIDISRLGLMLMNGQPKTTAEYIQATSRVGRSDVPGLVVTLLRPNKPRDRSHYETFHAYHESIYRHVEPTSVTPWSIASRDRSLPAALIILMRHGAGLTANDEAGDFRAGDRRTTKAVEILKRAVAAAEPDVVDEASRQIDALVVEWDHWAHDSRERGTALRYDSTDKDYPTLMRDFGERKLGWQVMHSMRSVDRQVRIRAIGEAT